MAIYVESGAGFEDAFDMGISGLTGVFSYQIVDNIGNIVLGPHTTGVVETPAGSGIYGIAVTAAPTDVGQYTIVASTDGSFDPATCAIDDLVVVAAVSPDSLPPITPSTTGGPVMGPCSAWTDGDRVAACCNVDVGTMTSLFDEAAGAASILLFGLSGRQFSGLCGRRVRPCGTMGCGFQMLDRGYIIGPWDYGYDGYGWWGNGWRWNGQAPCGCNPLSRVLLSGYPVRAIAEVKIDGNVIDPSEYRLDEWRYLTRLADADGNPQWWPGCQRLDLPDTEPGTFAVSYVFGVDPPQTGIDAATELACEIYRRCIGDENCRLPIGATRVTRQGITIERQFFGRNEKTGSWQTGLAAVDAFLSQVNPNGLIRRPVFMSPMQNRRYARPVG